MTRYAHTTGPQDNTFCIHCGLEKPKWTDYPCATMADNAPMLHINRGDEHPGIVIPGLRDQFAIAALTGPLSRSGVFDCEHGAALAYQWADAMMKERDAK